MIPTQLSLLPAPEPGSGPRCAQWQREWQDVPGAVAKCPECQHALICYVDRWMEVEGYCLDVICESHDAQHDRNHQYLQSDWQPVIDAVTRWANSPNATGSAAGN